MPHILAKNVCTSPPLEFPDRLIVTLTAGASMLAGVYGKLRNDGVAEVGSQYPYSTLTELIALFSTELFDAKTCAFVEADDQSGTAALKFEQSARAYRHPAPARAVESAAF
jgi:hypothetical protein